MARFSVREIHFRDHQDEADDSTGLPLPLRIKIVARGTAGDNLVPGMLVKVETVVTSSLSKKDLDPRYDPKTKERLDGTVHRAG